MPPTTLRTIPHPWVPKGGDRKGQGRSLFEPKKEPEILSVLYYKIIIVIIIIIIIIKNIMNIIINNKQYP